MFNNKIDGMGQAPNVNFGLKDTQSVQCTECQGAVSRPASRRTGCIHDQGR